MVFISELNDFKESITNKSDNTIKSYIAAYKKLKTALDDNDIRTSSEKTIILIARDQNNLNTAQSILNIAVLVRRIYDKPIDKIRRQIVMNKDHLEEHVKKKNKDLTNLPTYQDLLDYLETLYEKSEWTKFIMNYLLIHLQVRNMDLVFEIIKSKKESYEDKTKNYLWINKNDGGRVVYIRNSYKTANTYKQKVNIITDKKFITAVRRVMSSQKHNEKAGIFIDNLDSLHYHIQKSTLKGIGEGMYMKIVVNHFREDLQKLREISSNRGTSLDTIASSYDIENL